MSARTAITKPNENHPEKTDTKPTVAPLVDIYENEDEILLVADVPGVKKEGVEIRLDKDKLTLRAAVTPGQKDGLLRGEANEADYARSFIVPAVDAERISASLQHGVLRVHLPKPEAVKPHQIPVTSS